MAVHRSFRTCSKFGVLKILYLIFGRWIWRGAGRKVTENLRYPNAQVGFFLRYVEHTLSSRIQVHESSVSELRNQIPLCFERVNCNCQHRVSHIVVRTFCFVSHPQQCCAYECESRCEIYLTKRYRFETTLSLL